MPDFPSFVNRCRVFGCRRGASRFLFAMGGGVVGLRLGEGIPKVCGLRLDVVEGRNQYDLNLTQ